MLLKMLDGCDCAIQECNQVVEYIGGKTVIAPMTPQTIRIYGNHEVVNIYPRTDNVYGVMFEIESPNPTMDE